MPTSCRGTRQPKDTGRCYDPAAYRDGHSTSRSWRICGPAHKNYGGHRDSNVLGTVNPIAWIVRRVTTWERWSFVDAAETCRTASPTWPSLDLDFLAFSGHKMLGPNGVGGLYGRRTAGRPCRPFSAGEHDLPGRARHFHHPRSSRPSSRPARPHRPGYRTRRRDRLPRSRGRPRRLSDTSKL